MLNPTQKRTFREIFEGLNFNFNPAVVQIVRTATAAYRLNEGPGLADRPDVLTRLEDLEAAVQGVDVKGG
jgi:hypothetical protein